MRNNFVVTSVFFFKMSESEHSDSEFYYPGELSDDEMLQLLTHNEATERKSNEAMLPRACPRSTKKNENEKKMVI